MTRMTSDIENLQQLLLRRPRPVRRAGPHHGRRHRRAVHLQRPQLALITIVLVVPALTGLSLWFRSASDQGYGRVRDGIAGVLSDLSESLAGVRVVTALQPPGPQRHASTARSSASTATPTTTRPRSPPSTAPARELLGTVGQAIVLADRRPDGAATASSRVGELAAFVLYLNAFFQPIQQLVQLYNTYQQGQAAITKLRDLLDTEPSVPEAADAVDLPPIDGEIVLEDVAFGYDPSRPGALTTSTCTSPPARRSASSARPAPASPRWPSWSPASTTRPPGRVLHRRPRPARRHPRRRCAASSAWCRRSRSCSPAPCATTSPSPGPTPPTTRSCEAVALVGLDDLVDRAARGPRHRRPRARRVAVVRRAPAARPGPGLPGPAPGARARRGHVQPRPAVRDQGGDGRSTCCSRAAPRSSSPTASPPPCGPTASSWSTTAASSRSAATTSWSTSGGRYAAMYETWVSGLGDTADDLTPA